MKNLIPIIFCLSIYIPSFSQDYRIEFPFAIDTVACIGGGENQIPYVVFDEGNDLTFGTVIGLIKSPGIEISEEYPGFSGLNDTIPNGLSAFNGIRYRLSDTFALEVGQIIFQLSCSDTTECDNIIIYDTISVYPEPSPAAIIDASSLMFCDTNSIFLFAIDTNNVSDPSFEWIDGSNSTFLSVDTPGVYWVRIFNDCGADTAYVTLHPGGVPSILFNSSSCNYASDTLITTVYASDISRDSLTFLWTNNSGDTITNGGDFIIEADSFSSTLIVINTSGDHTDQVFNASASNACGSSTAWNCSVALPISLIAFEGNLLDAEVFLSWSTATEINNDYFTIERSIDGENFSELAQIDGAGNSLEFINYEFVDDLQYLDLTTSTLYYRLKQTDFDGQYTYSDIIAINIDRSSGQISSISSAYIENDQLNLTFDNPISGKVEVELITMEGRQILYHSEFLQFQKRLYKSVGFIPSGVYAVVLSYDNQRDVIKIVK